VNKEEEKGPEVKANTTTVVTTPTSRQGQQVAFCCALIGTFTHKYKEILKGIGCKVIYEEGLPNI
jgi:hypothetical protein